LFIWKTAIIWFEGAALPTILYFLTILNTGEFSDISLKRVFSLHPFTKLSLSLSSTLQLTVTAAGRKFRKREKEFKYSSIFNTRTKKQFERTTSHSGTKHRAHRSQRPERSPAHEEEEESQKAAKPHAAESPPIRPVPSSNPPNLADDGLDLGGLSRGNPDGEEWGAWTTSPRGSTQVSHLIWMCLGLFLIRAWELIKVWALGGVV
jgi:hypothetical protein